MVSGLKTFNSSGQVCLQFKPSCCEKIGLAS